jgi:phosphoglucomutase
VFQQEHYLANFVQATFNALRSTTGIPRVLVVGGDGRYFAKEACQIIIKMAAANGVQRLWVGQNGLLSTPAVSAIIRNREGGFVAKGAFILTASHNPGGPTEDFGIKYNGENGGPAPEKMTNLIYQETLEIKSFLTSPDVPDIDLAVRGVSSFGGFSVEVISSTEDYVTLLTTIFDFGALGRLIKRSGFTFVLDAMHGVAGPYARKVFAEMLGADCSSLLNANPLEDFGRGHPDPNLTYAHQLVETMGLRSDGSINTEAKNVPDFGAAFDGDADRNMILGKHFFVTPSDSVAILAAQSDCIPFFRDAGGLKSVARSMPTSGALDLVAREMGIALFEVPTGWKFFGNLMDSRTLFHGEEYNPLICGEESFGTGSNHVREKDGLWAVLAWLSVMAKHNEDASRPLVSVQEIVEGHWGKFGRSYYCRYDYEGVDATAANELMDFVRSKTVDKIPPLRGNAAVKVDDFEYHDPVDGTTSSNQGVRVRFADGSRFVLRLSGTGSSGATIRLYMEQYMVAEEVRACLQSGNLPTTAVALEELVSIALQISDMKRFTGRNSPTVVT